MTVDYYQQLVTIPYQPTIPALHKQIYSEVLNKGEARDFVYTLLDYPIPDHMAVLARSINRRPNWRAERVKDGDVYDFEVTCEIKRAIPDSRKKYSPKDPAYRMIWFHRQAKLGGFTLIDAFEVQHRLYLQLTIEPGLNERIYATTFTGRLRVTNSVRFAEELTTGFGKSMTYGLGMMLLTPVLV